MASVPFQIGGTPNPNSIRVGLSNSMFPKAATYHSAAEAEASPIARELFSVPGVVQVFTLNNFISINKDPKADWSQIEPRIAEILMKHLHA
jgi:hypothetical protein